MSQLKQIVSRANNSRDDISTKKYTVDNLSAIESEGTPDTCLEKLRSLISKLDNVSDISISELAEKLGLKVEQIIENGIEELRDKLKDVDPSVVEDAFKKILKNNAIYDALQAGKKGFENIGAALEDGADWIESKIKNAIDDFKNFSLHKFAEDTFSNPFKSVINLAKEIGDQLNRKACNGKLLADLSDLIGDIENSISDYLKKLTGKDIKDLLEGKISSLDIAKLLRIGIVANSIYDMFNDDDLNNNSFMRSPTDKTINNTNLDTSIYLSNNQITALSGGSISNIDDDTISGIVVNYNDIGDNTIRENDYTSGGMWDIQESKPDILDFGLNHVFVITREGLQKSTDTQFSDLIDNKYIELYSEIDYNNPKIVNLPVLEYSSKLKLGDVVVNIGISGDTEVQSADDIHGAAVSLTYAISKRMKSDPSDDCNTKLHTVTVLHDSVQFYGLGISDENARINAYLESKNKVLSDIVSYRNTIINY
jgi:hypothetical protein